MSLACKWSDPLCFEVFTSAEELFNHLCDLHVGRKRHGNLSLSCRWEGCDHKAAKRDHMTSHMMVHCPLQTNVCGICEKTFKRSYDLRKHEVTHTAEHHQAHTRSRAVIYTDLEVPFPTDFSQFNGGGILKNPATRSYGMTRGQSTDASSMVPTQAAISQSFRRGNSMSGTRSTPYERPIPMTREKNLSHQWDNKYQFSSTPIVNTQTIITGTSTNQNSQKIQAERSGSTESIFGNYRDNNFHDEYPSLTESPSSSDHPSISSQQPTLLMSSYNNSPNSIRTFSEYTNPLSQQMFNNTHDLFQGFNSSCFELNQEFRRSSQPNFMAINNQHQTHNYADLNEDNTADYQIHRHQENYNRSGSLPNQLSFYNSNFNDNISNSNNNINNESLFNFQENNLFVDSTKDSNVNLNNYQVDQNTLIELEMTNLIGFENEPINYIKNLPEPLVTSSTEQQQQQTIREEINTIDPILWNQEKIDEIINQHHYQELNDDHHKDSIDSDVAVDFNNVEFNLEPILIQVNELVDQNEINFINYLSSISTHY